ncbi:flagellar filament capping protein FliD [bacterium]|nr:flagellar filament capping protein FliD [bacterium]
MYISGLSSNIDTTQIIEELMSIERSSIDNIKVKQNLLDKKKEIYNDISSRLNNLKSLASDLSSESAFNIYNVSYSEQSIVQWTIASNAAAANYSVTVNSIATAHTIGSDRKDSSTEALGLTAGVIKINGVDIEVNELDSLNSIRDKINNAEDANVRATVVDNVLRLRSVNTGAENQIQLVDGNNILADLGILSSDSTIKNEFVAASDASITIDGQDITSSTNSITDVIDGATLQLLKTGTTNVSVERDTAAIAAKIKNFVNQYNSAIDLIYSKVTEKRIYPIESESDRYFGLVNGDVTLNNIKYNLNNLFTSGVSGLDESLSSLANIGITKSSFNGTTSDSTSMLAGKLVINDTELNEAIASDFEAVKNLFTKNNGVSDLEVEDYGIGVRVNNYLYNITNSTTGILKSKSSSFEKEISMFQKQIETVEARLETKEESLIKKFAAMEAAMNSSNTQLQWLQQLMGTLF